MGKFLGAVLIFLILAIGAELYFLAVPSPKKSSSLLTAATPPPRLPPSSPTPFIKVVRQAAGDTTGRTVIFQSDHYQSYSRTGVKYIGKTKVIAAVIGIVRQCTGGAPSPTPPGATPAAKSSE